MYNRFLNMDIQGKIYCLMFLSNLIHKGQSDIHLCGTNLQEYNDTKWTCENGKVVLLLTGANKQTTPPEVYLCGSLNPYDAALYECVDGSLVLINTPTTPKALSSTAANAVNSSQSDNTLQLMSIGAAAGASFVIVCFFVFVIWRSHRRRLSPTEETDLFPV